MGKQIITGGTGITASGNVNFGNVSGQVAIGQNNTKHRLYPLLIRKNSRKAWNNFKKK